MKKLNISLAAIFAMSTFAVAGGDIAPVEPVVEEPVVVESTGNFYLGLAYGYLNDSVDITDNNGLISGNAGNVETLWDEDYSDIMIQAGYNFNQYIAVEGRYWFGVSDTTLLTNGNETLEASVDAWGIYVKPQYPVTDAFNIYALLGYGAAQYDYTLTQGIWKGYTTDDSFDGFSWGLGASYAFTENVAVFVDYISIYDNDDNYILSTGENFDIDRTVDSWNFGVTYNF